MSGGYGLETLIAADWRMLFIELGRILHRGSQG